MNDDHPNRRIGYNPKLFINQEAAAKYLCTICSYVLRDPVQIPQSLDPKRACKDCYNENIRDGVCPIFGTHNTSFFPDKYVDREIKDLTVICGNKENGCTWSDSLGNYEAHVGNCDYRHILCERCKQLVIFVQHQNHCPSIPVKCNACSVFVLRKNLEDHNLNCKMQYQTCECGERIPANELKQKLLAHWSHQRSCLYSYIGCGIERSTHHNENHEALVVSSLLDLKQSGIMLKQSNEEKGIKFQQLEKDFCKIKEQTVTLTKTKDEMNGKMKDLNDTIQALKKELEICKSDFSQIQIPVIGGGPKLKRDIEELKSKVSSIGNKNADVSKSLEDMDFKIQLQENKTTDGELIWKIDKIELRMAQARSGKKVALHSVPCYTKQYEYKYCVRLYLQGDGMGRSTHISLFFVVMRSEYDQLLSWPMHKRITFELVNHENEADNVIESFVCNPMSSSFQRPTNNMNVAAGCPTFISIERFLTGGFVADNCAYIKTSVQEVD